jgi:hypothetical protein
MPDESTDQYLLGATEAETQRLWEQARSDDALLMLPELIGAWTHIPA